MSFLMTGKNVCEVFRGVGGFESYPGRAETELTMKTYALGRYIIQPTTLKRPGVSVGVR